MTNLVKKLTLLTGAVATTVGALSPVAASAATAPHRPLSAPTILTHLDLKAGDLPENQTFEPDGSMDVNLAISRQVARIGLDGSKKVLATLPLPKDGGKKTPVVGFPLPTGLVRALDGTLYIGYAAGDANFTGLWRLSPNGTLKRISALPANSVPNGIDLDERSGVVYVADSYRGTVWRVPAAGGKAVAWAKGKALNRNDFLGVNGLKLHGGAVWVSNTDSGKILRIPVLRNGKAGGFQTRAKNVPGVDDFQFTGRGNQLVAAINTKNKVDLVQGDGSAKVVLTGRDGISNPTSIGIRSGKVYVTSASFSLQKDPNILVATVNPKAL